MHTPSRFPTPLAVALAVLLLIAACTGGGDQEAAETTTADGASTTIEAPVPAGGATTPAVTNTTEGAAGAGAASTDRDPLTGESLGASSGSQVVAVKVDNLPEAHPQIGLAEAGMLIEIPVEGGLTRFIAMYFDSDVTVVGPVRSARPTDADLLAPWTPAFASTGGQDFVLRELRAAGVQLIGLDETPVAFQRVIRPAPHNWVATVPAVVDLASGGPPETAVLPFGEGELSGGEATSLTIPFSSVTEVSYRYEDGTYLRFENGEPFQVVADPEGDPAQLGVDTVVVLSAAQRSAGYTDSAGADVPTFDVIGFGPVQIFHGGRTVSGQWLRAAQEDPFVMVDDEGASLTIPPGKLILEVVPRSIAVDVG